MIKAIQHDIQVNTHLSDDGSMYSLLESTITSGNLELFEFYLNTVCEFVDIKIRDDGITPLIECLHHREYDMARSLIRRGANPHVEGYLDSGDIIVCPTTYALFSSASFFE